MEKINKEVITFEAAEKELIGWLDFKKIGDAKRESNKDAIKTLASAISEGVLRIESDKTIVHVLKFPIETSEHSTMELRYRPRVSVKEINRQMTGIKSDNIDGRLIGYAAALTGEVKAFLEKLDSEDNSIAVTIALFFL